MLCFSKVTVINKYNRDKSQLGVSVEYAITAQKMKFSIKDFFGKCDQIRSFLDLVTFTEEILHGKLHFLCSAYSDFKNVSIVSIVVLT